MSNVNVVVRIHFKTKSKEGLSKHGAAGTVCTRVSTSQQQHLVRTDPLAFNYRSLVARAVFGLEYI